MYKVFINQNSIEFSQVRGDKITSDLELAGNAAGNQALFFQLFEDQKNERYWVASDDPQRDFYELLAQFKMVEAAGGVVITEDKKMLWIKRNGVWDLPKGKVEENEDFNQAARREVREECGIEDLEILVRLTPTYHYYYRDGHIIKPTHWYLMQTKEQTDLQPQAEEGITEVKWVKPTELREYIHATYASIGYLLQELDIER